MFLIRWSKRGKFAQDVIGLFPAFNQTPVDMGRHALRWSKREYQKMQKKSKNTKKEKKYKAFNQTCVSVKRFVPISATASMVNINMVVIIVLFILFLPEEGK